MAKVTDVRIANAAKAAGFQDVERAVAVALAESGGNADAIGDNGSSFGLWQINKPANGDLFRMAGGWSSPETNAKMAHAVFARQGWSAWTMFNNGTYLLFIPRAKAAVGDSGRSAVPVIGGAIDAAGAAADATSDVLSVANAATKWVTTPANWLRVAYVTAGIALVVGALLVLSRPVIEPAIKMGTKIATKGAV